MNVREESSGIDRYRIAKNLYQDDESNLTQLPLNTLRTFFDRNIYDYLPQKGSCEKAYFDRVYKELSLYGECFVLPRQGKIKKLLAKIIQDTFLASYTNEQLSNAKGLVKNHFLKEQKFITEAFNEAFEKLVEKKMWRKEIDDTASEILKASKPNAYEIELHFDEQGDLDKNSLQAQLNEIGLSQEDRDKYINEILEHIKKNRFK